jgi:L-amino acid N-acyltransferase YncA
MIRNVSSSDAEGICEIYNHYVKNSVITFEENEVSPEDMILRIVGVTAKLPWIVFCENEKILGYAYAGEWKLRCAYKFSVETTVYLHSDATGKGIGTKLYQELIERLTKLDLHVAIGGISLPNDESIGLHEKFGFEKVAHFKELGYKFNKWVDVGYWELILS